MKRQGLAEWFFESGEPTLLEVSFKTFLRRFRPGLYEFEAETIERDEVECEEELTHVIPCAPVIDAEEDDGDIIITWLPVTTVVNTAGTDENVATEEPDEWDVEDLLACDKSLPLEIIGYEIIVETENENRYTIELPGDAYSVAVPPEFLALGVKFQYEVIAIEESGNQTITEEEFCLDTVDLECPDDEE